LRDLPTIQRISGHKTMAMVLRYTHVSATHIDDAMSALDGTTGEPISPDRNATGTEVKPELHTERVRVRRTAPRRLTK
jgi:hypothetical protein